MGIAGKAGGIIAHPSSFINFGITRILAAIAAAVVVVVIQNIYEPVGPLLEWIKGFFGNDWWIFKDNKWTSVVEYAKGGFYIAMISLFMGGLGSGMGSKMGGKKHKKKKHKY